MSAALALVTAWAAGGAQAEEKVRAADIDVDLARVVSESAGDDLEAMRRIFQSASAPEANGGLAPAWPIAARLGMQAMRIINDASECGTDIAGRIDRCDRLHGNLQWARRYRLVPHVVVGQTRPPHMTRAATDWSADDWSAYETYAAKLVRWVVLNDGIGFREAIFEVGNEVDITGNAKELWTLADPAVPQGHASRYEHYMRVFRVWSRAVATVAAEQPGRRLLVAGPAMGGQGLFLSGGAMFHDRFLALAAAEDLRLDLLTLHFYGDFLRGWPKVPKSDLRSQLAQMRDAARRHGRADVPIHITEWAASEDTQAAINTRHEGGAWAAAFVVEAFAGGARGGSYWLVRDALGAEPNGIAGIGSYTHLRNGRDVPKPQANVFALFNMLPGERRAAKAPRDLRALAATDGTRAGVLASNHGWNFWTARDESTPRAVRVVLRGLADGAFVADRYVVDETHANPGAAGGTSDGRLERVERIRVRASKGVVTLPTRTLGRSAVSLWLVGPDDGAADARDTTRGNAR